jgi:hypothetical protein
VSNRLTTADGVNSEVAEALAQQIVADRRKHRPVRRVEDLMAIKRPGIGQWKTIQPYLRLGKPENE